MLGHDVEEFENLVQHLAVLGGGTHQGLADLRSVLKSFDRRGHFDGFRSGSKIDEDLFGVAMGFLKLTFRQQV